MHMWTEEINKPMYTLKDVTDLHIKGGRFPKLMKTKAWARKPRKEEKNMHLIIRDAQKSKLPLTYLRGSGGDFVF